jgi:hypothetical protein
MNLSLDDMKSRDDIKVPREVQLFIPVQFKVREHIFFYKTAEQIVEKLRTEIPKIELLRNENELCLLICVLVENIIPRKSGIDKKRLVLTILEEIFENLTEEEKQEYERQIQYDFDKGKMRRVPMWKYAAYNTGKVIYDFFF